MEITIVEQGQTFHPAAVGTADWDTEIRGVPGRLRVNVLAKDLPLREGQVIRAAWQGKEFFQGRIFSYRREKHEAALTCYDALRFLKNRDSYVLEEMTASALLQRMAGDLGLPLGTVEDTGRALPARIEDNRGLFDILLGALDDTKRLGGESFILYAEGGGLCLRRDSGLTLHLLLDEEGCAGAERSVSVDSGCYSLVKLSYENAKSGVRQVFTAQDAALAARWGPLQYYDKLRDPSEGEAQAQALLGGFSQAQSTLTVRGVPGDVRLRAGWGLEVNLPSLDMARGLRRIQKAKHSFSRGKHVCDLTFC